ncbi:MAG: bifunctional alpha/beta hydrolase/OsmC family protein, partial [Parvibaculum sp.]
MTSVPNQITSRKVTFKGSLGDELAARLDVPDGPVRAYALFAHCFTCSKDIFAAARISTALAARGIAVLRFDFTGLGMSGGDFGNTNFSSNVGDLVAAANFLRATYQAPTLLVGHSLGGTAVLAAADEIPEAVAVATIGAPADAEHVKHNFADRLADIGRDGEAEVKLVGRTFRIKKQFLLDVEGHRLEDKIAHLHKALIIFHAPLDNLVGIDNATKIFLAARHPKSFVSLDKADHLLTRHEDATYVAEVLSAWSTRYLPEAQTEASPVAFDGTVHVADTHVGNYQQRITLGAHQIISDVARDRGGMDEGASPHDILLGALGACTAMTIRMYAERKGWQVNEISVALRRDLVAAQGEGTAKVEVITRDIMLRGPLDAEMREKLLGIANKCPVHQTLMNKDKRIDTR